MNDRVLEDNTDAEAERDLPVLPRSSVTVKQGQGQRYY